MGIKKVTVVLVLILSFILVFESSAIATSNSQKMSIPDRMLSGTVIEYDENNDMVIIDPGKPIPERPIIIKKQLTDEDQKILEAEEEWIVKFKEETKDLPVYKIENPEPQPGMRVIYDGEGYIRNIVYAHEIEDPGKEGEIVPYYTALPRGTRLSPGVYTYGAHNNKITISGTTSGSVLGEGRFTVFDDYIGENDNVLVKGDVATKGNIDNPHYNTTLNTRNTDNQVQAYMRKRDNGALPDAVLDVWKNGVEYYGLTYSPYLSFGGRYYYTF